jgi:ABC-2 type transport system permease protein
VFTALVLLGVVVGTAPAGVAALPVAMVAVLEFLLFMALSRLVSTTLSAATSKRRWRDVALFIGPLLALVINGGLQLLDGRLTDESGQFSADPGSKFLIVVRRIARWLPTGWGAQTIHGARTHSLVPLVGLVATAALIALIVVLWWRAIQSATTSPATGGGPKRGVRTALFPRAVTGLPKNALGGIVAKELRYSWREPRRRAALLGLLTPALFPLLRLNDAAGAGPRLCLLAALPMLTAGANPNLFGFDGDRYWVDVVASVSVRTELLARTLARALVTVPMGLVLLGALVVFTRSPSGALPALGLMAAVLGVASGYSAIASVRAPFPMPDVGRGNIFGSGGTGGGSAGGLASLAVVFGTMITVTPLLIAAYLVPSNAAQLVVFAAGLVVCVGAWLVCVRIAIPRQHGTEADLLAKLTRA